MNRNEKSFTELPKCVEDRIEKIRLNSTDGALKLARQAAESLTFLVDNITVSSASELTEDIEQTASKLVKAQPTMAPIFNLTNGILLDIDTLDDEEKIKQTVRNQCQQFIDQLESSAQSIGELAADLMEDDSVIIVHSYSDTVLKALLSANEIGKSFHVICTESRPMNEGLDLAEKLGKQGIKTTLVVDSAIFSFLSEAKLIFVGADALSQHGLVNKIGTLGLALAAEKLGVDLYTLCGSEKILPANYRFKPEKQKNPTEVSTRNFSNVSIMNYYFDLTPLDYLTGIITEDRIDSPNKIEQRIRSLRVHEVLSD